MKMDNGLMNSKLFDRLTWPTYENCIPEFQDYFRSEAAAVVPLLMNNPNVLDFGCGYGREFSFLEPFASSITAFDINQSELEEAGNNPYNNIKLARADARNLPFKDNTFDLALMLYNIFGNVGAERSKILSEAYRVLKPKGLVAISVYSEDAAPFQLKQYQKWNIAGDVHITDNSVHVGYPDFTMISDRLTKKELTDLLFQAGFTPGVRNLNEFSYFGVGLK